MLYEHVVVEHLPQTHHKKAQSALHNAVRADQSAITQARKQSWRAFVQLDASSKRRKQNLPGKNVQPLTKQLKVVSCAKDSPLFPISVRYNTNTALSPSFQCFSYMHAASRSFSWSSWIVASRQFAPKIADPSVRFSRILFYIFSFVSKRSGGRLWPNARIFIRLNRAYSLIKLMLINLKNPRRGRKTSETRI